MKICPQCQSSFPDDYVFCMTDGTTLTDSSQEQETVVSHTFRSGCTSALSPDMVASCQKCGMGNRGNSRFCKRCGENLTSQPGQSPSFGFPTFTPEQLPVSNVTGIRVDLADASDKKYDETVVFTAPKFEPPSHVASVSDPTRGMSQNTLLIGILLAVITVSGGLLYSMQETGQGQISMTTSSENKMRNASNTTIASVANAVNVASNAAYNSLQGSAINRTGYLTENLNIRAAPNRVAEIRGTHYQNARVKVLAEESYSTNDGWATWYRLEVIQDGCDSQGRHGCGNNWERNGYFGWMEAERTGWMNARYIILD